MDKHKKKTMQPIRDLNEVLRIADRLSELTDDHGKELYLLWIVGVNMGLRVGDLVNLRVGDMRQEYYSFIPEKQRNKRGVCNSNLPVPDEVRIAVEKCCAGLPDDAWLFPSKKAKREKHPSPRHPNSPKKIRKNIGAISRQTAWQYIQEIRKICGIDMPIGCHTMRKTFGYHHYLKGHSLGELQDWFQHKDSVVTLKYIGIDTDKLSNMIRNSPFRGMVPRN